MYKVKEKPKPKQRLSIDYDSLHLLRIKFFCLAMLQFDDISFKNSDPPGPNDIPPEGFFSLLPYRVSKFREDTLKTAQKVCGAHQNGDVAETLSQTSGHTEKGHVNSWAFPETPPDLIDIMAQLTDLLIAWDGEFVV